MRLQNYLNEKAIVINMVNVNKELQSFKQYILNQSWFDKLMNMISGAAKEKKLTRAFNNSEFFKRRDVTFKIVAGKKTVMPSATTKLEASHLGKKLSMEIRIPTGYLEYAYEENTWHFFVDGIVQVYNHEVIHYRQYLKDKTPLERIGKSNKRRGTSSDQQAYLSDKHEIMAYANTFIHQLYVIRGMSKEEIIAYIKNPTDDKVGNRNTVLSKYLDIFGKINHPVMKRFIKYAIQYLEDASLGKMTPKKERDFEVPY